jgi:hypothetical protein
VSEIRFLGRGKKRKPSKDGDLRTGLTHREKVECKFGLSVVPIPARELGFILPHDTKQPWWGEEEHIISHHCQFSHASKMTSSTRIVFP